MIINFSIQNFGIIKERQTLSFEATKSKDLEDYYIVEPKKGLRLLKVALIYGANGSGKSTILKALDFLREIVVSPLRSKNHTFDFKPFLFDEQTARENSSFSIEFVANKVRYLYEVELNKMAVVSEKLHFFNPNKALVYERTTDMDRQLSAIEFGSKIKIDRDDKRVLEGNTLWNNTVLGAFSKSNLGSNELAQVSQWFNVQLNTTIRPRTNLLNYVSEKMNYGQIKKANIVKFLKKADFKISDVRVEEKRERFREPVRYGYIQNDRPLSMAMEDIEDFTQKNILDTHDISFIHEIGEENDVKLFSLPYGEESEGTQRYYQMSGLLDFMIRKSMIFSIDELESSLHADLLKHFILTFLVNAKNSQLIATTHHRELLMERDIFRNDAIWFTEKQADGQATLFSLNDFDTSVIRDTSSVYNAYKVGKLGARPVLGDYFVDIDETTY